MTGLLMVAAEELNIDMSQMRCDHERHRRDAEPGHDRRQLGDQLAAASRCAPPRRPPTRRCSGSPSTQLGVPAASLTVSKGVVSGGGKTVTYGQLLGGKLFNVAMGPQYNLSPTQPPTQSQRRASPRRGSGSSQGLAAAEVLPTPAFVPSPGPGLSPGAPGTKPVSQYKLVGISPGPPRVDIPAKVTGKLHLRPEHPHPRDAARPHRPPARAGRLRRRARTRRSSRSTRARSATSRASRSCGRSNFLGVVAPRRVGRDPGGGAAEGAVGGDADAARRAGTSVEQMRPAGHRRPGAGSR